jgi:hypothetical protein
LRSSVILSSFSWGIVLSFDSRRKTAKLFRLKAVSPATKR